MSKPFILKQCKKDLMQIYDSAIRSVKPESLIKSSVTFGDDGHCLSVKSYSSDKIILDTRGKNIHVIGGGKSVMSMAKGLDAVATGCKALRSGLFSHGCISVPQGVPDLKFATIETKVFHGSTNNLPDKFSIEASKSIFKSIDEAVENDKSQNRQPIFIVLISGGGSACLTSPRIIDLETKLSLLKFLVQKGADIVELNKVRRYFSNMKGGRLASYILSRCPESKIISLILSDIINDPIEFIASGPTYCDGKLNASDDHWCSMLEVLKKYNYTNMEQIFEKCNNQTTSESEIQFGSSSVNVINTIIGNNFIALQAAESEARQLGYQVKSLGNKLEGYTEDIVGKFVGFSADLATLESDKKGYLILGAGEATINKREHETWGKGGRTQEMAIDYLIKRFKSLDHLQGGPIDIFLAGSTDGQDGPTDVAGCLVSGVELCHLDFDTLTRAKACHDSYNFWTKNKPESLIKIGLTGTNVMDLYMCMLAR